MIMAHAIKELHDEYKVVGYRLRDEHGTEMDVKSEAIIKAMKEKAISISNLSITDDNKLVMKDNIENSTISKTDIDRIRYLVDVLNKARKVYEQGTDEIMSNYEYDSLYDELLKLESKTGIVLPNSPTINVGYEVVSSLPKEKHKETMLSLDKTKDVDDLADFLGDNKGVLSWKMDGLTVVLTYNNGRLQKAVTRGNGEIGEVVTNNAYQFKGLPKVIEFKGQLVLRGEAVISYTDFEKINSSITLEENKYKNPRNLCSGSVRQLDSGITAQRNVRWYAFQIVTADEIALPNSVIEQFEWLRNLGFNVVEHRLVDSSNLKQTIKSFEQKLINKQTDIPSDGLVLTYNDILYGKRLGNTAKAPRHSKAFKWKDETALTKLKFIEWSPSRTGLINPVAIFEPVDIEGSTIQRASVHNVSILAELQLGYGDEIEVYKANMIIPQILENNTRSATCEIPSECPECGGETTIYEDPSSGVLTLYCTNPNCTAKGNRLLQHFVSRDAMNIDGISKETLIKFSELGIITDFASIYHIKDKHEQIVYLEGFGEKSFANMVDAIEKSREVKLANLIYALGIPNIGLATAKLLCRSFNNDFVALLEASFEELTSIDGIGGVIADSFIDYFSDNDNMDTVIRLAKEVRIIKEEIKSSNEMSGITLCVTGKVYRFENRDTIKNLVESMGGKLTSAVSKSTSYLVTNDKTSGSSKNRNAQAFGIPILTEDEFIEKFNLEKYL